MLTTSPCCVCGYHNGGALVYKATVLRRKVRLTGGIGALGPWKCRECGAAGVSDWQWPHGYRMALDGESRVAIDAVRQRRGWVA